MTRKETAISQFMGDFQNLGGDASSSYGVMMYSIKLHGLLEKFYDDGYCEGFEKACNLKPKTEPGNDQ